MSYAVVETTDYGAVLGVAVYDTPGEATLAAVIVALENAAGPGSKSFVARSIEKVGYYEEGAYRVTVAEARDDR